MLTKNKIPLPDMLNAVLIWDASALEIDQFENIVKLCESKEGIEMLKNNAGDKYEQLFMELMKVPPRLEEKLQVFGFKITFASQVEDLKSCLNTIKAATKEVKESTKLHQILQTISTQENLKEGSKLDGLVKLSNNKMTLMHDLCKFVSEKMPELVDFANDLVHLEAASKIESKPLTEKLQEVTKGLQKVEQELIASENDGAISEGFRKVLKEFLDTAENELRLLIGLYSETGRIADSLFQYFGEDPNRCSFEQVTKILIHFMKTFIESLQAEKKILEKEKIQ